MPAQAAPYSDIESEDDVPAIQTAAEKARATRRKNAAQRREEERELVASTRGVRKAKLNALENPVWKEKKAEAVKGSKTQSRPRSESLDAAAAPPPAKKTKAKKSGLGTLIEKDDQVAKPSGTRIHKKTVASSVEPEEVPAQAKSKSKRSTTYTTSKKQAYAAAALVSDDESIDEVATQPPPKKTSKSASNTATEGSGGSESGEDMEDASPAASEAEDADVVAREIDHQLQKERPVVVRRNAAHSKSREDLSFRHDPMEVDEPPPRIPRRPQRVTSDEEMEAGVAPRRRTSSRASERDVPPDTDPEDLFNDNIEAEVAAPARARASGKSKGKAHEVDLYGDELEDVEEEEDVMSRKATSRRSASARSSDEERSVPTRRGKSVTTAAHEHHTQSSEEDAPALKKGVRYDPEWSEEDVPAPLKVKKNRSAQQARYDAEVPEIHEREDHAEPVRRRRKKELGDQREWPKEIRLVLPSSGLGNIGKNDQTPTIQRLLGLAMFEARKHLIMHAAYDALVDRVEGARPFLKAAARAVGHEQLRRRVKKDDSFVRLLADLVLARLSLLRNSVKVAHKTSVDTNLNLNAPGVTAAIIRERVRASFTNQSYIFPVKWVTIPTPVTSPVAPDAPAEAVPASYPQQTTKLEFDTSMPFFAAPIVSVLREVFFSTKKSLGRLCADEFVSYHDAYPTEHELPPAMIALVTAHYAGMLNLWKTGHKVAGSDSEFSQQTLETTYVELVKLIEDTRAYKPLEWHRKMHQLFKLVTQNGSGGEATGASYGSAANIMNLL